METIKRQTRAACGCLAARSSSRVRGLSLQPVGGTPALSVTQSAAAAAVCALVAWWACNCPLKNRVWSATCVAGTRKVVWLTWWPAAKKRDRRFDALSPSFPTCTTIHEARCVSSRIVVAVYLYRGFLYTIAWWKSLHTPIHTPMPKPLCLVTLALWHPQKFGKHSRNRKFCVKPKSGYCCVAVFGWLAIIIVKWWRKGREFESHQLCCRVRPLASRSRTPASVTIQYNLVQQLKLGSKQAHRATHWHWVNGTRLRATESEISAAQGAKNLPFLYVKSVNQSETKMHDVGQKVDRSAGQRGHPYAINNYKTRKK